MPYLNKSTHLTPLGAHVTIHKKSHPNVWLVMNDNGVVHSVQAEFVQDEPVCDVVIEIVEKVDQLSLF